MFTNCHRNVDYLFNWMDSYGDLANVLRRRVQVKRVMTTCIVRVFPTRFNIHACIGRNIGIYLDLHVIES